MSTGIKCSIETVDVVSKAEHLGQVLGLLDEYQDGELLRSEAPAKVKEESQPLLSIDDFLLGGFGNSAPQASSSSQGRDEQAYAELEREAVGWDTADSGFDMD